MRALQVFFTAAGLFLCVLLAGCSASDGLKIDCELFEDRFDQEAEVTVAAGEEFTVTLCSMRNRGYRWSEQVQISSPDVIEEVSRIYEPRRSPMGGIPGLEIWTFRALQPGSAVISMEHRQLSGRNTRGVWSYHLDVSVEAAAEP